MVPKRRAYSSRLQPPARYWWRVSRLLDSIAVPCGWDKGEIRANMFRHTYCAARLQTLDQGAPVSPWTVGRELGHGGHSLVNRVYGHLGEVRHRSEQDRKSTRLNSSHVAISYAVFCLKKKKKT